MIVAKNDEAKRSRLWRTALLVSSVLIVLIVIFLLTKLFTTNPLEGRWEDENGKISLNVESGGAATVTVLEAENGSQIEVPMEYTRTGTLRRSPSMRTRKRFRKWRRNPMEA